MKYFYVNKFLGLYEALNSRVVVFLFVCYKTNKYTIFYKSNNKIQLLIM